MSARRLKIVRPLLLDGALGCGQRFQAFVRDRLAAIHRDAIGASGESGVGALDCRELLGEILREALFQLFFIQVLSLDPPVLSGGEG